MISLRVLFTSPLIRSGMFTHVCDLAEQLRQLGLHPYLALINHTKNNMSLLRRLPAIPVHFYSTSGELSDLVRKLRINLIHSHSPLTLDSSHRIAEKLCVPLVITLHGIIHWPTLFAEALAYASGIIATGPETAWSAGREYYKKTTVIFNGVNIQRFRPPPCETTNGPLRILYFGRTRGPDAQGVTALDKAVGMLRQKGRKLEATLAGHVAGVFPVNLKPCGWVDDPVPHLQRSHVAFGRGRSLREAMACGNVGFLLGQGYGGILHRELFTAGTPPPFSSALAHGARVPEADVISSDLALLCDNRALLQSYRKEARLIAEEHFDSCRMAEKTVNVYRQALR